MRKETRRFVSIHSFCRRCALGNDRKRVPLSLCLLSRALQKKSRASSRFQQMYLLLATSFHHRAVVCFSTVSLAFPRDDDEDERREMMAPRRRTKERKKEASESFFFLCFGREKKRKRRKKFWCQDFFFFFNPLKFFPVGGLWSVFFF